MYVLECEWAWDHSHNEFASFSVEDFESKLIEAIGNLLTLTKDDPQRQYIMELLQKIGRSICNGIDWDLVRLWRVVHCTGSGSSTNLHANLPKADDGTRLLTFKLEPIYDFKKDRRTKKRVYRCLKPNSDY